ncbi:hypothetical protein TgHK011_003479 [Trichoderma gracile]|nr:hypothetical protein TgHK011_003479 [Trichoderma gracile]
MRNLGPINISHGLKNATVQRVFEASMICMPKSFELVEFLPAYLPQFNRLHSVWLDVSLGAHTAWRLALAVPGQIEAYAMVVGCPSLSHLLLARLGVDPGDVNVEAEKLETVSYEELEKVMDEQKRRRWLRALAELVHRDDKRILKELPRELPLFTCNGEHDKPAPARYTTSCVQRRNAMLKRNGMSEQGKTRLFTQENAVHSCTKEMAAMLAAWLGGLFELSKREL